MSEVIVEPIVIRLAETVIELQPGEHYAGAVLDEHGNVKHHVVKMAALPPGRLAWQPAMDWAASVGGSLPDRQEQALLYANCKPHLEQDWTWSCETSKSSASYAWECFFLNGDQDDTRKSYEGCAVAVRRI